MEIETLSKTAKSDAVTPLECAAKYICALEADGCRHALDILIRHRQPLTCFIESQVFDKSRRRYAEGVFETTAELARGLKQTFAASASTDKS